MCDAFDDGELTAPFVVRFVSDERMCALSSSPRRGDIDECGTIFHGLIFPAVSRPTLLLGVDETTSFPSEAIFAFATEGDTFFWNNDVGGFRDIATVVGGTVASFCSLGIGKDSTWAKRQRSPNLHSPYSA